MKGTTYKRCPCPAKRRGDGKRINCTKKHGTWSYTVDVPLSPATRIHHSREQITRGGFSTEDAASAELRSAIALLSMPESYDDACRLQIAEMIRVSYKQHGQIPSQADVRRRLVGGLPITEAQTVGAWLDEWLAGKRRLSANTARSYAGHVSTRLKPALGQIPLEKLRRSHIEAAYNAIWAENATSKRPIGVTTLHRIHATLRAALNDAVRQRRLADNPALWVELPSAKRPKPVVWTNQRITAWLATGERPAVAVWTPRQTGRFLDHIADDRLYALYHLLVFGGLRRGEGIGLREPNLDLDEAAAQIVEQIVQVGWTTFSSAPKAGSDGEVALDTGTVAVLRAHATRQKEEKERAGSAWKGNGHVFTTETGEPLHPDYVSRHFARLVKQANRLRLGSVGPAVMDVQRAFGLEPSGVFDVTLRRAVFEYQRDHGLKRSSLVDPQLWFRLFPDDPLRDYPHPGYLPPIRLHDLRHGTATLALGAGADIKVVSAMLRHTTLTITADTYTAVLPELARVAAEATAASVPRAAKPAGESGHVEQP
jgi:integrase